MSTPHISAEKGQIAKRVVVVGDPMRAEKMAKKFLNNSMLVNEVRGMLAYTGKYNNEDVTIMGHGMGLSSIAIYVYELFDAYGVDTIIRAGSCGSFSEEVKVRDIIVAEKVYTDANNFGFAYGESELMNKGSQDIIDKLKENSSKSDAKGNVHIGSIISSQWFYKSQELKELDEHIKQNNILATEMEAYALNAIAKVFKKKVGTILTVSDNIKTKESLPPLERQNSFSDMIKIALDTIINF